jgi:hypothetical protein
MTRKAVLIAASIALALGSSSAAFAKGKKPLLDTTDPRVEAASKGKQGWCSLDSSCNGWGKYWEGIAAHKKFKPVTSMVIPHV